MPRLEARTIAPLFPTDGSGSTGEMADAIGDGLRTLGPTLLQRLLQATRSVKARCLALWFADRHAQPWRQRLEPNRIDLGTGNRTLAPKRRLDPTYHITDPRGLDDGSRLRWRRPPLSITSC